MKKILSAILSTVLIISGSIHVAASEQPGKDVFRIISGTDYVLVTESQFDEYDPANDDIDEFIEKYSLVRQPLTVEIPSGDEDSMRISNTRASVNLSAHRINSSGMNYYNSNGRYFEVYKSFTFKAKFSGQYPGVNIGYTNQANGMRYTFPGGSTSRSESWKFDDIGGFRALTGYMSASGGEVDCTGGSITWS